MGIGFEVLGLIVWGWVLSVGVEPHHMGMGVNFEGWGHNIWDGGRSVGEISHLIPKSTLGCNRTFLLAHQN